MDSKSVPKLKCPLCENACSHRIIFSSGGIEHLRCSECGKVSVFSSKTSAAKDGAKGKKKRSFIDYDELMERRGSKKSNRYSIKKDYTGGDYLSHPKFGDGYVLASLPPNKMEVLFVDDKKLLICAKA